MATQQKATQQRATQQKSPQQKSAKVLRLPDGSRSVQSPWVWRGFLFMSLIALGFCITFAVGGQLFYGGAWGFITVGWFSISMWLWRKHIRDDDEVWQASQRAARASKKR
jgi:hypothetical protein